MEDLFIALFWKGFHLLSSLLNKLGIFVIGFLPESPFQKIAVNSSEIPYLEYLNWFVPITEILGWIYSWLWCVLIFYAVKVVLRWIKVIG